MDRALRHDAEFIRFCDIVLISKIKFEHLLVGGYLFSLKTILISIVASLAIISLGKRALNAVLIEVLPGGTCSFDLLK